MLKRKNNSPTIHVKNASTAQPMAFIPLREALMPIGMANPSDMTNSMTANRMNTIDFKTNLLLSLFLCEYLISFADQQHGTDHNPEREQQPNGNEDTAEWLESRIESRLKCDKHFPCSPVAFCH